MTRKVTNDASRAFCSNRPWAGGNTTVTVCEGRTSLILHGHTIAWREAKHPSRTYFSMCGYPTVTTRERMGAAGITIGQQAGLQYIHNVEGSKAERLIDESAVYYTEHSKLYKA